MSDLRDLYQDVILDHNKRPRNFRVLPQPTHKADGVNPLCGDRISVFLDIEDGVIKDIEHWFEAFHNVVTTDCECPRGLGKLGVLAGVRDYPSRVKCATLAWHAVRAALEQRKEAVATE